MKSVFEAIDKSSDLVFFTLVTVFLTIVLGLEWLSRRWALEDRNGIASDPYGKCPKCGRPW